MPPAARLHVAGEAPVARRDGQVARGHACGAHALPFSRHSRESGTQPSFPAIKIALLTSMSIKLKLRKRLPPDESRAAALEAARNLLLEAGPQAVTLKAVSARIGRTHANLLHHFGSAA